MFVLEELTLLWLHSLHWIKKILHRRWPWHQLHQMLWKKVAQTKKKKKTSHYRLGSWQKNLSWFLGSWMLKYFTSNQVKSPTFSLGSLGVCYIDIHDHAWEQCPSPSTLDAVPENYRRNVELFNNLLIIEDFLRALYLAVCSLVVSRGSKVVVCGFSAYAF